MKIIAFAASLHSASINKQLAAYAASLVEGGEVEVLDLNDYAAPIYSQDREAADGVPAAAHAFLEKIAGADAIVISFAEHNGSYAAGYKSLFDWCSRVDRKVYQQKPMLLLSTSPGPNGGKNVLAQAVDSMPYFGGEVRASLSLPRFKQNFDVAAGRVVAGEFDEQLRLAVAKLAVADS